MFSQAKLDDECSLTFHYPPRSPYSLLQKKLAAKKIPISLNWRARRGSYFKWDVIIAWRNTTCVTCHSQCNKSCNFSWHSSCIVVKKKTMRGETLKFCLQFLIESGCAYFLDFATVLDIRIFCRSPDIEHNIPSNLVKLILRIAISCESLSRL